MKCSCKTDIKDSLYQTGVYALLNAATTKTSKNESKSFIMQSTPKDKYWGEMLADDGLFFINDYLLYPMFIKGLTPKFLENMQTVCPCVIMKSLSYAAESVLLDYTMKKKFNIQRFVRDILIAMTSLYITEYWMKMKPGPPQSSTYATTAEEDYVAEQAYRSQLDEAIYDEEMGYY